MPLDKPHEVPVPAGSRIAEVYRHTDLADAYAIDLPQGTTRDPEVLARFIFSNQPRFVGALMEARDSLVSIFGLKTGRSLKSTGEERERIGMFKIYETHPFEVLMGEDDKHLDFRASLLYREAAGPEAHASAILSTVVKCHNLLGRSYLKVITPFHRFVVKSFLRRAAKVGWPQENTAAPKPA